MKLRRNRVIISLLFLVWLGGMYFFLIGQHHSKFSNTDLHSREQYIAKGKKARLEDEELLGDKAIHQEFDPRKIQDFDAASYINFATVKPDEDAYARNAYNQKESDKLAIDREVPDVRDPKYVLCKASIV